MGRFYVLSAAVLRSRGGPELLGAKTADMPCSTNIRLSETMKPPRELVTRRGPAHNPQPVKEEGHEH